MSYAPVGLAALLVIAFFAGLCFVIATDDLAGLVGTLGGAGWGVAGVGLLLGLAVAVRRGKNVLGLGLISAVVLTAFGVAVVAFGPSFTGPAHYNQGQQAFGAGNYERAIAEYRQAGNADYLKNEVPQAYLKWGDELAKKGQFEAALAQYERVAAPEFTPNPWQTQLGESRARLYLAWADRLDKDSSRNEAALSPAQRTALQSDLLAKYDAVLAQNPAPGFSLTAKSGARNVLYRQAENLQTTGKFEEIDALYERLTQKYLDGKPQSQAELDTRRASNYQEWSRQLSLELKYDEALRLLQKAEGRLESYDPGAANNVVRDIITNYSKLAPQLIQAGKYDEAVGRLEGALTTYGPKDPRNTIAQALLNSYYEYGQDLTNREQRNLNDARIRFKQAYDLNAKYNFKDNRPREGLGRVYLAQGQEAEAKQDWAGAIALYREGQKSTYFSQPETASSTTAISRSYFNWAQSFEASGSPDKALTIYREGLLSNGFEPSAKNVATDAGGEIFLKQGREAEGRSDLQGAVNVYAALAADPQFKTSAGGRNLVNIAPKVMYPLAEQFIRESQTPDQYSPDRDKLTKARDLLQVIISTYGQSDLAPRAREIVTAPVFVVGKILNNKGEPLANRPIQFSTGWKFCTADLPADDPECRGRREGFQATGDVVGATTAPDGGWVVKLVPGKRYLVSWQERGGKWTSTFVGGQGQQSVLIQVEPMLPIKYEYRTPTDAPL